ncbi:MAG: LCP family protein [Candidatus Choladocola sp.]|nr:LCP family protein [Candidatus Choladocola sp.]
MEHQEEHNRQQHSHHHRKHHHSRHHRLKHAIRRNRKFALFLAVFLPVTAAVLILSGYYVYREQEKYQVSAGRPVDMGSGYRNITYRGKEYRYNELITTVLYAGIDSTGPMEVNAGYASANRADSIAVVVLDKKNKKMTVIPLSRDTMTQVRRYSMNGRDRGLYTTHLGFAYSYGDGGEVSCENLREAVSLLLGDIPIDEYAVTNQDSMTYLNHLVGGVTVEVPNEDLAEVDPDFVKGNLVTLDDSNVGTFLQYRDTAKDLSNEGRMERQQTYVTAYVEKLKVQLESDLDGTWEEMEKMEDYLQTSITRNKYIGLANLLNAVEFTYEDFYRPAGENVVGEEHDEFYVDSEALREKVIEIFYEEI